MGIKSEKTLSVFKYLLAIAMMFLGIESAITPTQPVDGPLGMVYSERLGLVIFGLIIFSAGASLLYGKVRKSRKWTGKGLFSIYLCLLFAALIQFMAFGEPGYWVPNLIASFIVGSLWLRWKFKTEYVNPGHFRDDIVELRTQK